MGDRALNHVMDMFADEEPWMGELPSIRLDHATLFSREMIDRVNAATMTFAVVSHTIFLFAEYDSYERNLSPEQFEIAYPIRSFYEHLPFTALSSDTPGDRVGGRRQRLRVDQGGRAAAGLQRRRHRPGRGDHGSAGTAALHRPGPAIAPLDRVGLIEKGYEGSFVVLDRDIFSIPPEEIDQVTVAETWIGGVQVFGRALRYPAGPDHW